MIYGVGIDLLEISRVEKLLDNTHFMNRVYTASELEYINSKGRSAAASAAAIFCAKEAVCKALKRGLSIPLKEIEVIHGCSGEPYIRLHGRTFEEFGDMSYNLSLTHTATTAGAVITAETGDLPK